MAANLKLVFDGNGDKKISLSFPYANADADSALVKTLMQEIVANGDIYAEPPVALRSAEFSINTTISVDIG